MTISHSATADELTQTAEHIQGTLRHRSIASFPPSIAQNPYQRLLYEHLVPLGFSAEPAPRFKTRWLIEARRRVGILHFHWPEGYYRYTGRPERLQKPLSWIRLGVFIGRLVTARCLGYRIVWTIHQVAPHEVMNPRLDRAGTMALARLSHVLVAHDQQTAELAKAELGVRSVAIVPHGSYIGVYPPGRARETVRREFDIAQDAFAFLCFGHIRAYKDIDLLIEAFTTLADARAVLVVAGLGLDPEAQASLRRAAAADERIRPIVRYIRDSEVAEFFGACDAAVLARSDGGTSGALILALSLGTPVVAARRPVYEGLVGSSAGWLFEPGDPASLTRALARASADPDARRKGERALEHATGLSWPEIATSFASLLDAGCR